MPFSAFSVLAVASVPPPPAHPVDLHPALAGVRQMREFQPNPSLPHFLDRWFPQWKGWIDDALARLGDALTSMLSEIARWFGKTLTSPDTQALHAGILTALKGIFLTIALTALLMGLVVGFSWARRRYRRWMAARAPRLASGSETAYTSAAAHRREAARLASLGQFEAGVRELYLAAVRRLDEVGWAPYDASRTRLEILRRLAGCGGEARGASASFAALSRTFEAARFGARVLNAERFDECLAQSDALEKSLENTLKTAAPVVLTQGGA
ncbi:MAG: DUF4129 domain-containing protein [Vampirovibrionales bacterium]|nr:DUF4129 domain-containing protein [Vampirovibrionales bacterium]